MSAKGWNIQEKDDSKGINGSQKFSLPNTSSTVDNSINLSAAGNEAIQFVHIRRQEVCASEEFATITKKSPCDPRDIGDQIFNKSKPTQQEIQLEKNSSLSYKIYSTKKLLRTRPILEWEMNAEEHFWLSITGVNKGYLSCFTAEQ